MRPALATILLAAACGASQPEPPPAAAGSALAAAPSAPAAAAPHTPGVDLPDELPPPPAMTARSHPLGAPAAVALVDDRALLHADVPVPPRGGSVPFQLPDDRDAWVTQIPESVQLPAPAYGDGRVYVSGGFESTTFYALDAETGRIAWATRNLEDNGPTAPIYDGGRVMFNTESCTLFALDAKTGKRLWFHFLGDPTLAQIASADGLVFASHPAPDGQELGAYRVATGAQVWSYPIGSELLAAPVIAGDAIYVSTLAGQTFKLARATGALRWQRGLEATTAPWVAGDGANAEVYLTRHHAGGEQRIVVSASTGKLLREDEGRVVKVHDDVPAGLQDWKSVWAFEGSRPVIDRGIRYDAVGDAIVASDTATGAVLWSRRDPDAKGARALGSVAFAGSAVIVSTRSGKVFGLDVDTGYTLWSYDLGHKVVAEPVIANGWVYVTTADGLAIGLHVADPTLDGWHMFGGNPQHEGIVVKRG